MAFSGRTIWWAPGRCFWPRGRPTWHPSWTSATPASAGRPSCAGAVEMVVEVVRHLRRRNVVVVADGDGPGIDGADRLAQALTEADHRPKVIRPTQGKDARAWVQAGATREVVDAVIANALYWRP